MTLLNDTYTYTHTPTTCTRATQALQRTLRAKAHTLAVCFRSARAKISVLWWANLALPVILLCFLLAGCLQAALAAEALLVCFDTTCLLTGHLLFFKSCLLVLCVCVCVYEKNGARKLVLCVRVCVCVCVFKNIRAPQTFVMQCGEPMLRIFRYWLQEEVAEQIPTTCGASQARLLPMPMGRLALPHNGSKWYVLCG